MKTSAAQRKLPSGNDQLKLGQDLKAAAFILYRNLGRRCFDDQSAIHHKIDYPGRTYNETK